MWKSKKSHKNHWEKKAPRVSELRKRSASPQKSDKNAFKAHDQQAPQPASSQKHPGTPQKQAESQQALPKEIVQTMLERRMQTLENKEGDWPLNNAVEIQKLVEITTGNVLEMLKNNPQMLDTLMQMSKAKQPPPTTPERNRAQRRVSFPNRGRGLSSVKRHRIRNSNFMKPTHSFMKKVESRKSEKKCAQSVHPVSRQSASRSRGRRPLIKSFVKIRNGNQLGFESKAQPPSGSKKRTRSSRKYTKSKKELKKKNVPRAKRKDILKNPVPQNMNRRAEKHKEMRNNPELAVKFKPVRQKRGKLRSKGRVEAGDAKYVSLHSSELLGKPFVRRVSAVKARKRERRG